MEKTDLIVLEKKRKRISREEYSPSWHPTALTARRVERRIKLISHLVELALCFERDQQKGRSNDIVLYCKYSRMIVKN